MSIDGIVLFVHILGVIALFGGMVVFQNAGRCLRWSGSWSEARNWLGLLRRVPGMFIGGSALLLISGLYMASTEWGLTTPWVVVAVVSVVSFALCGTLIVGRGITWLRHLTREREGPIPQELRVLFCAPALWSTMFAMNGAALGILWLMTNKPGWAESITVPLALAVVGGVLGRRVSRPRMAQVDRFETQPAMGGGLAHGRTRAR